MGPGRLVTADFILEAPLLKKKEKKRDGLLGEGKSSGGGLAFLVPTLEVPYIPLTLCHGSLIDMNLPLDELEERSHSV